MTPVATGIPDDDPDPRLYFLAKLKRQLPSFLPPSALPQYRIARQAFPQLRPVQQVLPQFRLPPQARPRIPEEILSPYSRQIRKSFRATLPTSTFAANLTRGLAPRIPNPASAGFIAAARPMWAAQIPLSTLGPTLEAFRRVRLADLERAAADPYIQADVEAAAGDLEKSSFFADTLTRITETSQDRPADTYAKVTAFVFSTMFAAVAWSSTGSTTGLRTQTLATVILTMMVLIAHYTDGR